MNERKELPCKEFKAEPGAEVVAYSTCQECGWAAYQHVSWATDPDGTPGPDQLELIGRSPSQKRYHTKPGVVSDATPEGLSAPDYRTTRSAPQGLIDTGSQNITGYKPQPEANRDLVNEVKQLEADHGFWMTGVYFAHAQEHRIPLDPRQVESARTHFEYAFYHLNRAVFQPADPIGDAVAKGLR